jgi:hypothetical protein
MDRLPIALIVLFAGLAAGAALRAFRRKAVPTKQPATATPKKVNKNRGRQGRRHRITELIIVFFSTGIIVLLIYWAFQLTQQAPAPAAGGTASLLVTGNPFTPADKFQLGLVSDDPTTKYVEYHIVTGCNSKSKTALLMLSGNARLSHVNDISTGNITTRSISVGQPWFSSPTNAQIIEFPVTSHTCPSGVSPSDLGSMTVIGGYVKQPMEDAAGATYALQLPLVGNTEIIDSLIPALGSYWAVPIDLSVSANAGGLPLYDRIDVTRPELTSSGGLNWGGQRYIWPSATWTNLSSASRGQFLILVIGALIGIFGSAPVTVVLDWIRGPENRDKD